MLDRIGLSFRLAHILVTAGNGIAIASTDAQAQYSTPSTVSVRSPAENDVKSEPSPEELLKSLRQSRVLAAKAQVESIIARFEAGTAEATVDLVLEALGDLEEAELEVTETPQARVAARSNFVSAAFGTEMKIVALFMAGDARGNVESLSKAKSRRLKGQVDLVAECIAAKVPLPQWPLLPLGSPDGRAAALVDELGGTYSTAAWFAGGETEKAGDEKPTISFVVLDSEKVDDATILKFAELRNLAHLELVNTKVTEAGVAALKKSLPKLEVARSTRVH